MHFDLLEALLKRDSTAKDLALRVSHDDDSKPLFKTLIAFSTHHDTRDDEPHALVATCAAADMMSQGTVQPAEGDLVLKNLMDYLLRINIVSRDSGVLKPDPSTSNVVSVMELTEAFEEASIDHVHRAIGKLLSIMDNRQYFFELLTGIALARSDASVIVMEAAWRAVDILGWDNHFTPFVFLSVVDTLWNDKTRFPPPPATSCGAEEFEAAQSRVNSFKTLSLFAALYKMHQRIRLLDKRLHPHIAARLETLPPDTNWSLSSLLNAAIARAAAAGTSGFSAIAARLPKISFNF